MNQYVNNNIFPEKERKNVAVFSFCRRFSNHNTQFPIYKMNEKSLMACGGGGGGGGGGR